MSDSLFRPHGLKPTRVLCPWDSSGKNTGVGCYFLLQGIFLTQGSNPRLRLGGGFFTSEPLTDLILSDHPLPQPQHFKGNFPRQPLGGQHCVVSQEPTFSLEVMDGEQIQPLTPMTHLPSNVLRPILLRNPVWKGHCLLEQGPEYKSKGWDIHVGRESPLADSKAEIPKAAISAA